MKSDFCGSPTMFSLVEMLVKLMKSFTNNTLLLNAEDGLLEGPVIARHVHGMLRPRTPFVEIDCAKLGSSTQDIAGAFFGWDSHAPVEPEFKKEAFGSVGTGVLHVRNVTALSHAAQIMLGPTFEERTYVPLQGTKPLRSKALVMCSTEVAAAKIPNILLDRFYYRLHAVPLKLPPLEERFADLPPFIRSILLDARVEAERIPEVVASVMENIQPSNMPTLSELRHQLLAELGQIVLT